MWNWLTGAPKQDDKRTRSIFSSMWTNSLLALTPDPSPCKTELTLEKLYFINSQLKNYRKLPMHLLIESLRAMSEYLVFADQHQRIDSRSAEASKAASFFDFFGEKNIVARLLEMGNDALATPVQVQMLQTLSIWFQNISSRTVLFYILSNNFVNRLLQCPFSIMTDEDVRDWYVTLLKALALRLDTETVQFFLDQRRGEFSLFTQAIKFRQSSESMIQIAIKTIMLQILQVNDPRVHQFLLLESNFIYFDELIDNLMHTALKTQKVLNDRKTIEPKKAFTYQDGIHAASLDQNLEGFCSQLYYLQDLLQVNVPDLAYRLGSIFYERHVKAFLVASLLPTCQPPAQRVCTALATFLLAQIFQVIEYAPLVNATCFLLFYIEQLSDCSYSAMTFGAGASSTHYKSSTLPSSKFLFRTHSSERCTEQVCYFKTRFQYGEWPIEEVSQLEISGQNCIRGSILKLVTSSDPLLSYNAMLLLWHACRNSSVDRLLLKEVKILEARESSSIDSENSDTDQEVREASSLESIMSASSADSTTRLKSCKASSKEIERSCLIDPLLLALNPIDSRLRNLELAIHLLLQTVSKESVELIRPLDDRQAHTFKEILSRSAERVMLNLNDKLPESDCIQVIEDEVLSFRAPSSISSRFLMRQRNQLATSTNEGNPKSLRRAVGVFLTLRNAYRSLYPTIHDDLDRVLLFRHAKTQELHRAFQKHTLIKLEDMVSLSCVWNPQASGAFILSPEAIILVQVCNEADSGHAEFFLPIHSTKCTNDIQNSRMLHLVAPSNITKARISILFENDNDCSQAQAHIQISCTEVCAFKLQTFQQCLDAFVQMDR
uniref:Uncharacterized protein AlNc14C201G8680 n=1 Tax=Albugo laibachii Nc14 TaxID=890382 RepID=F0WQL3_9STRA|nr:conserved hypothetical protein [Albugo laibachii Nc14]|eukprot:CCA23622.1 conserved hypothetical protein [Albugo laibachii Nc14]